MFAYKFRSSAQIDKALDIIFNKRLYCADWKTLNDPMEGMFVYSYQTSDEFDYSQKVNEIIKHKKGLKVCSLSKTYDCHLLWAHYANGFDGLAVEIEINENVENVHHVSYGEVFSSITLPTDRDPLECANQILSSKYKEWSYEKELRILNNETWYEVENPVKRIIVGHRINPALFTAIKIICKEKGIILCRTGIRDERINADLIYDPVRNYVNG